MPSPKKNRPKGHPLTAEERAQAGKVQLAAASDALLQKVPPQSRDAEVAVLGGIFIKSDVLHQVIDILDATDFYYPENATIFGVIQYLYKRNVAVDVHTVGQRLQDEAKLDLVGGAAYLSELVESSVISAANAEFHARIVRDKAVARQLIHAASGILTDAFDPSLEVQDLIDSSEQAIFSVAERTTGATFADSRSLVKEVFEELQHRVERKELVTGVNTGYHDLNEMTSGLQPTDLIIVAGRPSMGKTAFALNVAMNAAVEYETATAIFSLEMGREQLMQRMLCTYGKVDLSKLRRGFIDDEDWTRLYTAADRLSVAPIYIDDTAALSILDLRARCRRLKADKGLDLVVVDYLQLMRGVSRSSESSREQEISEISRGLKALAKELKLPVVALSQLNRKVEERADKRPMLADLRESGAIEQDADIIIFLYREAAYRKDMDPSDPNFGVAEIIIGKQRNGPTGSVKLSYLNWCTAFQSLTTHYSGDYGE